VIGEPIRLDDPVLGCIRQGMSYRLSNMALFWG